MTTSVTQPKAKKLTRWKKVAIAVPLLWAGLISAARAVELDVGVVQRFGGEADDEVVLKAVDGDRLTISFRDPKSPNQMRNLITDAIKLTVKSEPLPEPKLREIVILGTFRSFETAEEAANRWRSRGIAVEIAQPSNRWQVWGDRDTYDDPLARRMLLESIQQIQDNTNNSEDSVALDSRMVRSRPVAVWTLGGQSYAGEHFWVTTVNQAMWVGKYRFGGSLKLQPNAYGTFSLVNRVPVETYLRGVVPYEIGPGAPTAALEAQTILARTYALRNVRRFAIDGYQICADTHCQVYRGLGAATARTDQAIARTNNQVLVYAAPEGKELADALYFSTSGGVTAAFEEVWNGPSRPYLQPVVDSPVPLWDLAARPLSDESNLRDFLNVTKGLNEIGWRDFRWNREQTLPELADHLRKYLRNNNSPQANFQTLTRLAVTERAPSGRVQKLVAYTDMGEITVHKDAVRSAFWPPRSTLFYLDPFYETATVENPEDNAALKGYKFIGGGWGHGVGFSQAGSYRLAKIGWSAQRIVEFYYKGAKVQPLTPDVTYWRSP
ncbi:MAG: SpoIID/LytB domain-containing protein [Cyanobacteria bacterium P01_C01_bin.89]